LGYGDALSTLQQKAEQGDVRSQYNLGVAYGNGEGIPQDYKKAVKWFRLAAEKGDIDAQYNMGLC